jgi:hypothetical protein
MEKKKKVDKRDNNVLITRLIIACVFSTLCCFAILLPMSALINILFTGDFFNGTNNYFGIFSILLLFFTVLGLFYYHYKIKQIDYIQIIRLIILCNMFVLLDLLLLLPFFITSEELTTVNLMIGVIYLSIIFGLLQDLFDKCKSYYSGLVFELTFSPSLSISNKKKTKKRGMKK